MVKMFVLKLAQADETGVRSLHLEASNGYIADTLRNSPLSQWSGFCKVFWGLLIIFKLSLVGHGTEIVNFVQLYFGQGNIVE